MWFWTTKRSKQGWPRARAPRGEPPRGAGSPRAARGNAGKPDLKNARGESRGKFDLKSDKFSQNSMILDFLWFYQQYLTFLSHLPVLSYLV